MSELSNLKKDFHVESDTASRTDSLPPYTPHASNGTPAQIDSPVPALMPRPARLLTVQANGAKSFDFVNSMDMAIPVFLGTHITAEPLYVSARASRGSNNAVLSKAGKGDILSTTYRCGIGKSREPRISYLTHRASFTDAKYPVAQASDDPSLALRINSGLLTRSVGMTSAADSGKKFKWAYVRTKTPLEGTLRVLALFAGDMTASATSEDEPIAVLVRSKSTRTSGTSKWDTGNGGQLLISSNAAAYLEEPLMIASCLMMLKKERDLGGSTNAAAIT